MTKQELEKAKDLIDDLGWDFQQMSSGGQETYKKICKIMGWTFECQYNGGNMDKGTNEYDADEPKMGYNCYYFELDEEDEDEV